MQAASNFMCIFHSQIVKRIRTRGAGRGPALTEASGQGKARTHRIKNRSLIQENTHIRGTEVQTNQNYTMQSKDTGNEHSFAYVQFAGSVKDSHIVQEVEYVHKEQNSGRPSTPEGDGI